MKTCQTTGVATLTVLEFAMWGTDLTCLFVNMSNSYKQKQRGTATASDNHPNTWGPYAAGLIL